MKHNQSNYISAFIIGSVTGGIITLLYTPYSGKELRRRIDSNVDLLLKKAKQKQEEIINKAKITADDLLINTIKLSALIEKYAGGMYQESRWKIENEITSLKAAIKAAVETYKDGNSNLADMKTTGEIVDGLFSNFDNVVIPKN